jgi:Mrp family chromosome partitioning ATPase/capsular polysaccharide biosynthesis protein
VRALRAHSVWAAVIFVLVLVVAAGYAIRRSPSYQATARLLVNPLPQTDTTFVGLPLIRDSGDPTRTMQTAATLVDSPLAAATTARAMGRGWTTHRVQGAVSVQPEGQSEILDITATDTSASRSAKLANTFAASSLDARSAQLKLAVAQSIANTTTQLNAIHNSASVAAADLQDKLNQLRGISNGQDPTLTLSQVATIPRSPSGPSNKVIALLALIAAIALSSGAVLLIELLRARRVLEEEQLIGIIPSPVVARVPVLRHSLRHRHASIGAPLPAAVSEALRGVRIQLDLLRGRHRTILVTSAYHGDGKTTTTVNLAREFAASGARVLVIDTDLRKPEIGATFGVQPAVSLQEALESDQLMSFTQAMRSEPNLRVLPTWADAHFQTLDRVAYALHDALERALEQNDYVLIDAPPLGEVADVLRFIGVVDAVLLVSRIGYTPIGSLEVTRELLDLAGRPPTGHLIVGSSPRHAPGYGYSYGRQSPEPRPEMPLSDEPPAQPTARPHESPH